MHGGKSGVTRVKAFPELGDFEGFGNAPFLRGIKNEYKESVKTYVLWLFLVIL